MKTIKFLRYFLLIALGTTLIFSCAKDEALEEEMLTTESQLIETRMAPDCEIEICVVITPNTTNNYPDIYIVEIPGFGDIVIQNGLVNIPGQPPFPLPANGEVCADIPVYGSIAATVAFKGYGAAVTTATWEDGTACEIFSVGVGTTTGMSDVQDIVLTCDPICTPTECTIEICAQITPNTTNNYPDIYQVTLPSGGVITIQNGIVNIPGVPPFPLAANGEFCTDIVIPIGSSFTAQLAFKGYGAVETTGTWPDGTSCLLFSVGVGTTSGQSDVQDVTLECDPPC